MNAQVRDNGLLGPEALATADGEIWVANAANAGAMESGATLRTSIGVGTGDSLTLTALTLTGGRLITDKGADIASGAAITPGTDGNYFHITGTTTITSIATLQEGAIVFFEFDGVLTLTHNGTSLILQGSVNMTTAAGDMVAFVSEGSGNWRELFRRTAAPAAAGTMTVETFETTITGASTFNTGALAGTPKYAWAIGHDTISSEAAWFMGFATGTGTAAKSIGVADRVGTGTGWSLRSGASSIGGADNDGISGTTTTWSEDLDVTVFTKAGGVTLDWASTEVTGSIIKLIVVEFE